MDDCQLFEEDVRDGDLRQKTKFLTNDVKHFLDEQHFRKCRDAILAISGKDTSYTALPITRATEDPEVVFYLAKWVWVMMEEYAEFYHGQNWRNLRALMEECDDVKELSASENGCLLLQLVEDDDYGIERLHRKTHGVKVQSTNIFDEMQGRLKRVGSNLDRLMQTSEASSKHRRRMKEVPKESDSV